MQAPHRLPLKRTTIAVLLFGTAFGYLEAAVVSYLRDLHEPARQRFYPGRHAGDLFPLLTLEQVRQSGAMQPNRLVIEIGREAATIIMLGAVALAVAENIGQWAAVFVITFGIWDITFYLSVWVILGWPASVFTWDILFLLPVPWVGPVLAPVLVSAVMIGTGVYHLWREATGRPVPIGRTRWVGIMAGAVVIVVAFAMDYKHIMRSGMPHSFNWGLFALGLGGGLVQYVGAAMRSRGAEA